MGKTAWMFPGQGAQYTGMGKDFYERYACSRQIFERASDIVSLDLKKIIFEEDDRLNQTEYTQIALYTTEIAMMEVFLQKCSLPDVTLGLSLGEYSAITAAGALSFEDGCRIVRSRGIFMEQAVPNGQGGMAAVLGLRAEEAEQAVDSFSQVTVANYNCPGQVVISGECKQLEEAVNALKTAGAKRVLPLKVSGPFHSPMLFRAGISLGEELQKVTWKHCRIPYVANYHADYVSDAAKIPELLIRQVSSSVRFEQSVRRLLEDGVDTFVEIGPGKTLSGFVKKIAKDMNLEQITIEHIENNM